MSSELKGKLIIKKVKESFSKSGISSFVEDSFPSFAISQDEVAYSIGADIYDSVMYDDSISNKSQGIDKEFNKSLQNRGGGMSMIKLGFRKGIQDKVDRTMMNLTNISYKEEDMAFMSEIGNREKSQDNNLKQYRQSLDNMVATLIMIKDKYPDIAKYIKYDAEGMGNMVKNDISHGIKNPSPVVKKIISEFAENNKSKSLSI